MSGRGRGCSRARAAGPLGPAAMDPAMDSPPPPPKRRTVADNAKAIESIESKLSGLTSILQTISERLPSKDSEPAPRDLPQHEHVFNTDSSSIYSKSPVRWNGLPTATPACPPSRPRHPSGSASHPYRLQNDTLGASRHARRLPATLHDIEEDASIQDKVAHYLTATLAPMQAPGKKPFPHSFVTRGPKRLKTTLADLSLPEFNLGFMRLLNSRDVDPVDRPHMLKHLEAVNEDATRYEWRGVRAWSEEVCARVADPDSDFVWSDYYQIDLLRLKLSQVNGGSAVVPDSGRDTFSFDSLPDITAEVRAARPAPPCRHFNAGACTNKSHHVVNGFRYLHICSHCILNKCAYLPHPERDCRSKDYRKKSKDQEPGFGK